MAKVDYSAVGRRKKAVARVRLVAGDGKVTINKRDIDNYFGLETLKMTVRQPLTLTGTTSFDVAGECLRRRCVRSGRRNSSRHLSCPAARLIRNCVLP